MPAITLTTLATGARLGRTTASFVGDLRRWKGRKETTDDILRRALATELCRNDAANPAVDKLARAIVERFWEANPRAGFKPRMKARALAARGLLGARQLDWPRWRDELSESIAATVTDGEIADLRVKASCQEVPSSAAELAEKFPAHFLEELSNDKRRNDYRVALRRRLVMADELQAVGEADRAAPELRVGIAAAASAAAGVVTANAVPASTVEEVGIAAAITAIGALLAGLVERHAAGRRRRGAHVRRFAARWTEELAVALERNDARRVECLRADLSGRLVARADAAGDDAVVMALMELEDVLGRCGPDPPGAEVAGALSALAEILQPAPEPERTALPGSEGPSPELPAPHPI